MSLEFAVARLYDTGWTPRSSPSALKTSEGLVYPSPAEVKQAFAERGLDLRVRHISLFSCYRAEWSSAGAEKRQGYCVGATEHEAAVFALAQLVESSMLVPA